MNVTDPPELFIVLLAGRNRSTVTVGVVIANAALRREESRGGRFRTDFPAHDDLHWKEHVADRLHVQRH